MPRRPPSFRKLREFPKTKVLLVTMPTLTRKQLERRTGVARLETEGLLGRSKATVPS